MIRTLNKPLLKEWTAAEALRPIPISTRSFLRCRRVHIYTLSPSFSKRPSFISLSAGRIDARYSTLPDPTSVKTQAEVPPPSKSIPPRKHKVDLRPAPKTLSKEARGATQAPASSTSVQSTKTTPSTTPSATTSTTSKSSTEGPIKSTQEDITDATKHGIFAPPPEGASRLGQLWHNFKQLFWFYWRGIKMIFVAHRKQAAAIQRRVQVARARGEDASMTRWETRFLRTYKLDILKLFPFVLTLLILEEALPLVVLYVPGLLPSTCLLPSQRERIEAKRRAKQAEHAAKAKLELQRLTRERQYNLAQIQERGLEYLSGDLTRAVSGILSRSTWGPVALQRRRIAKYLAYLSEDDALLIKEGMGSRLNQQEMAEALKERGFIIESTAQTHLLEKLQWWLKAASDDNARIRLVLQVANDYGSQMD